AYLAAMRGDFSVSYQKHLDHVEKGLETGVTFHFTRNQTRTELATSSGPNVAVFRNQRDQQSHKAEIEITDQEGKFYILEARQTTKVELWDVLVGPEETLANQ